MSFVVFCRNIAALDQPRLATLLHLHPSFTRADALIHSRRGVGPRVAEVPVQAAAESMVAICVEAGLDAFWVPTGDLVPNPTAKVIRNADCIGQGIEIEPVTGGRVLIPWADFVLLTCGVIRDRAGQGCIDAYTRSATPHLRFVRDEFNFDYLAARKQPGTRLNFPIFAGDLISGAAGARRVPGLEALAAGDFDGVPEFASYAAFEDANLCELAQLQRERAGVSRAATAASEAVADEAIAPLSWPPIPE